MADDSVVFNPILRDAGLPDNLPFLPIGALDELKEIGLSPAAYPSCAEPNPATRVRGCDYFWQCPMSYKGKPESEGGGPRRHAWKVARRGKPVLVMEGECWDIAKRLSDIEDNKQALQIIADEGETYQKLTGIAVKTFVDPTDGQSKKVLAKPGEMHLPNVQREDMVVDFVVKPFARPSENVEIAVDVVTAQTIQKEQERIRSESFPRALGLSGGGTPLDKRERKSTKREG